MKNGSKAGLQGGTKVKALTAAALQSDKVAGSAKEQARLAKAKLKAARAQLKEAKRVFKARRKLARQTAKQAKRARKALQHLVDRLAKRKKKQAKRVPVTRPVVQIGTEPELAKAPRKKPSPQADLPPF